MILKTSYIALRMAYKIKCEYDRRQEIQKKNWIYVSKSSIIYIILFVLVDVQIHIFLDVILFCIVFYVSAIAKGVEKIKISAPEALGSWQCDSNIILLLCVQDKSNSKWYLHASHDKYRFFSFIIFWWEYNDDKVLDKIINKYIRLAERDWKMEKVNELILKTIPPIDLKLHAIV